MFKRMTLFALAAFAAITAAIIAPSTASAFGHGGGGSHFGRQFGGGGSHFGGQRFGQRRFGQHHFGHWSRWSRWSYWPRYRWYRPYYARPYYPSYRPYYVGGGSTPTPRPAASCLTKQYMEDGTVVFQDRCTGEEATANNEQEQTPEQQPQQPPAPRGFRR